MVALGLFGCVEATSAFEVNIKLRALLIGRFIKRFVLLMQRNSTLEDIFRKVFWFEFIYVRCYLMCFNIINMYS